MVYVLDKDGNPLMPTRRYGKVRHLLKDGRAVVVRRDPFTIRLTYDSGQNRQSVHLGIDAGSKHIGLSATTEKKGNPSKLSYIENGLKTFCRKYADYNITSIAFPKLGCGNGELKWDDVKPLMEKYLKDLPIDVFVYLGPGKATMPEHKSQKNV